MSVLRPGPRLSASVVLLVAAVSAGFLPASAQVESPSPPSVAASAGVAETCVEPEASAEPVIEETLSMPEDFRIALFNGVWEGIRDFYVDPDTNGLDWEAIGDEYAPLVIATDNAHEVYELLREMVGLLEDPFTNFYSADDLADPAAVDPTYVGIGALLDSSAGEDVDGLRLVYVFPESPAAEGGLAARDRVVAVEGDPCVRIADIRGPEGTDVTVTVVSPGEPPRDVSMTRRRVEPVILPEAQRLPADPRVGYLRVIALSEQVAIDGIADALADFVSDEPVQAEGGIVTNDPIEALVLDLRASNQGAPAVMTELLRAFVSGEVGAFHHRTGSEPIDLEPNDLSDAYADMPIVVLVDAQSEAEAEQAAAILQDQGRATVVGVQTSGQTHGAQDVDFPDGSLLQLVSFGFQLPDGSTLEGQGVTPDVEVAEDWLDFPESADPYLLSALEIIDEALAAAEASPAATVPAASPSASFPAASPDPAATPSLAPATAEPSEG
jgi:carboxyl-terminal processing protease